MNTESLERIDPNMADLDAEGKLLWYNAALLEIEGKGWADTEEPFDRLPAKAQKIVRGSVWSLSKNTAGICLRFRSDATKLCARWSLRNEKLAMNHMTAAGVSGLDLYVRANGQIRRLGTLRPDQVAGNKKEFIADMPAEMREYQLYLPLYNGLKELHLGLPPEALLLPPTPRPKNRRSPIVFYGTSIVQGGCANRPGMAYPSILGRRLNRPIINLGFSGNGQMEEEMAQLLAELNPAAFVLDHLPNCDGSWAEARTIKAVGLLRSAHPRTPIILVECVHYQFAGLSAQFEDKQKGRTAGMRRAWQKLIANDCRNLLLVDGETLLGDDGDATVDGVHPTDLGFWRMATVLEPILKSVLPPLE
jgi:hypothetical protein